MTIKISSAAPWVAGGIAAFVGAAIFNRKAAQAAESEHQPIGQMIEIDGAEVHYTDSGGSGEAIVLIHGVGSLIQDFISSGLVAELAATHRVLTFDRPGYGYTTRPDDREWTAEAQAALLASAARRLGVERPVVVGHSWGTLVAIAWALACPEEVTALVLLAGYFYPTLRPDAMAMNMSKVPIIGRVFNDAVAPIQARLVGPLAVKALFSPADVPKSFMAGMPFGLLLRPGQLEASAKDGAEMPANVQRLAARYAELRMPITVMWGEGDKVVKQADQSARLVAQLPSASGMPTPGVGHMIHHVQTRAVAEAIRQLANQPVEHA